MAHLTDIMGETGLGVIFIECYVNLLIGRRLKTQHNQQDH